jgi:phosphate ABC transporter permease protein PstC
MPSVDVVPRTRGARRAGGGPRRRPVEVEAASASVGGGGRALLRRSPLARLPDRALRYGLTALAAAILVLIVYFFVRLFGEARPAFSASGVLGFVFDNDWNPAAERYGALPLLVGTLLTSGLALLMGVPVAVATALYLTELCPRCLLAPLTVLVELLAAVPSVVYGLWGIFFLAPKLEPAEEWVAQRLSFIPFVGGGLVTIPNCFIAGLILAIMILPIVSALAREVMSTVPPDHREAALGLGATRWEMIRMAVIPYCRSGIVGGAMLGLGRAVGETIAVTIVIGDSPTLAHHLFGQGYTLAAVIANEFGEATGLHRSALFAAALVLFVLTLLVNAIARLIVLRASRGGLRPRPGEGAANVSAAAAVGA